VERVLFALVAERALEPGSKLAATGWVAERVAIPGCGGFSDDAAYRAMDFLLDALSARSRRGFSVRSRTCSTWTSTSSSSTPPPPTGTSTCPTTWPTCSPEPQPDDGTSKSAERAVRRFGKSKDHRDEPAPGGDRDGGHPRPIPVRCWSFPGNESDQRIIGTIKDDLGAWNLHRLMWCADAGFASAANCAYLTRRGGHYILAKFLESRGSARGLPANYLFDHVSFTTATIHTKHAGK
jgi:hypothetical protein